MPIEGLALLAVLGTKQFEVEVPNVSVAVPVKERRPPFPLQPLVRPLVAVRVPEVVV